MHNSKKRFYDKKERWWAEEIAGEKGVRVGEVIVLLPQLAGVSGLRKGKKNLHQQGHHLGDRHGRVTRTRRKKEGSTSHRGLPIGRQRRQNHGVSGLHSGGGGGVVFRKNDKNTKKVKAVRDVIQDRATTKKSRGSSQGTG